MAQYKSNKIREKPGKIKGRGRTLTDAALVIDAFVSRQAHVTNAQLKSITDSVVQRDLLFCFKKIKNPN